MKIGNRRFFHFFKGAILILNIFRSTPMFTFIFRTKRINMRYAVQFPYSDRHVLYYHDLKVEGVTEEFIDELYSETGRYSCFADRDKPSGDNPLIVLSTCYMWDKKRTLSCSCRAYRSDFGRPALMPL